VRSRAIFAAVAAAASLLCLSASASAAVAPFCLPGNGPGQCNGPQGVAVDTSAAEPTSGHVYVADSGNNRVNVFESDGTFLFPFPVSGGPTSVAVDNSAASPSRHDVYVSSGEFTIRKFKPNGELIETLGSEGTGPCQFGRAKDPVAVSSGSGNLYVADRYDKDGAGPLQVFANRVVTFDPSGTCLGEVQLYEGGQFERFRYLAVDSNDNIYVSVEVPQSVRKYSPTGVLLAELDKGTETEGIAVDAADNLYAKQRGDQVAKPAPVPAIYFFTKYAPDGTVLRRFEYAPRPIFVVPALAAYKSPEGDFYASEGAEGIKYLKEPPPGPVIVPEACQVKSGTGGSVRATLQAEVNPESKASTFHFEYLTQAQFEAGGYANPELQKTEEISLAEGAADFELHEAAFPVEGLTPETHYHCRVVAENADGEATGPDGSFLTREKFEFGPAWTAEVGERTATVDVEGNPLGLAAKGQIEYVTDAQYLASGFAEAQSAPAGEIDFGAEEAMQLRAPELTGLVPGTLYHWRLRVRNGFPPEGFNCPEQRATCPELEHTFRTYLPEPPGFDDRGYELVSPSQKNSAEVAVPGIAGGFKEDRAFPVQAGAGNGEALTYTSWTSFGNAGSAPATSQYLSRRSASGWSTENISPFGFEFNVFYPAFSGFSGDLGLAALKVSEPPLTADCPADFENLYLRDNTTNTLRCLTPEAPDQVPGRPTCFNYAGASVDGSRAFFAASASYAGAPKDETGNFSLYEWSEGKLRAVSVLPGESEATVPAAATAFGPGGRRGVSAENCQVGRTILRHAISADGSRAFWTYSPDDETKPTELLVRVNGTETVQLDKVPQSEKSEKCKSAGNGKSGNGVFWGASADGSVVYFTEENRLISGSKSEVGEPDLYRYEIDKPLCERLTNLTKGTVAGDVKGVSGISDDGAVVYFVAGAVLSGAEENAAGLKAVAGKDNLYVSHEDATHFVATLAPEDNSDWESEPRALSARVSPDGRHLAFVSVEAGPLAGYDNKVAQGEHCLLHQTNGGVIDDELIGGPLCPQTFLYDADSGALSCASCNPAGTRPLGLTLLPRPSSVYEAPRYLSGDGSRLFFESYDSLLQADQNQKRDVYEFERAGAGDCSAQNPNFDPAASGCHFLVSSGKSSDHSYLIDASGDGRDVFFSTRSSLVGWDQNQNFDVYDYREGGGFPEPSPAPSPCEGEACKPPVTTPPAAAAPATPAFSGPGNAKQKKHKPKPKKKGHKHKKHKRHAHKQGSGK
jgi:hypothetical protein